MLKCWAPIGVGDSVAIGERAKQLEDRGYEGIIGNQVYGPPWASLAVAAASTTSLELETGIAMAFVRSPFETACAAIELDRISNGRFTLGLGTAPQTWTEDFFGQEFLPPISRIREVIEILRLVFDSASENAESIPDYRGEHYQLSFAGLHPNFGPEVRQIPIWVAALRERLCELAGECADGFIGHSIWSKWWLTERALPAIRRGATGAGRDPDDLNVQLWLTASIDSDPTASARRARGNVAFYASIPSYRSYFEAHGFGSVFDTLVEARRSVPLTQCIDLVPLDAARTFAICGTADEVGQEIEEIAGYATSVCVKPPMWGVDPEDANEQARQIDRLLLG
ncbi:MAG: LLM class flavin-dependent oxidoreductase [Actinomycetota bacterium]|nr:LLM class flavin-dependent oxidoreductase [Acidimicrobiales bacterium]MEC8827383.1 LLM class flavin-dependent oxidoreductase [Actinomycetota bacterium]MEC8975880.1 LLM class flavin-dependent oxidoreductase [Actinomycetota bacterium]MEC9338300.1 LLM class flavin-dependent oxidoreductase [Actinomycetota bacterium]MED6304728.1 LLM class flavin-dependent oxidoreductase [Actinomycetota bacterium]